MVTVSKNLDAFTISMRNNGPSGIIQLLQISHPNAATLKCDGDAENATPAHPISFVTKDVNIGCSKVATDSVLISMNTSAGTLKPIDLPGTVDVLGDVQSQLKALEASVNILPSGTIVPWYAKSGRIPNGWPCATAQMGHLTFDRAFCVVLQRWQRLVRKAEAIQQKLPRTLGWLATTIMAKRLGRPDPTRPRRTIYFYSATIRDRTIHNENMI